MSRPIPKASSNAQNLPTAHPTIPPASRLPKNASIATVMRSISVSTLSELRALRDISVVARIANAAAGTAV
jgi:hypothetical protein